MKSKKLADAVKKSNREVLEHNEENYNALKATYFEKPKVSKAAVIKRAIIPIACCIVLFFGVFIAIRYGGSKYLLDGEQVVPSDLIELNNSVNNITFDIESDSIKRAFDSKSGDNLYFTFDIDYGMIICDMLVIVDPLYECEFELGVNTKEDDFNGYEILYSKAFEDFGNYVRCDILAKLTIEETVILINYEETAKNKDSITFWDWLDRSIQINN